MSSAPTESRTRTPSQALEPKSSVSTKFHHERQEN